MSTASGERPHGQLTRVEVRNYRGIGHGSLRFGDVTLLVGPTGAGASSFVDAMVFVSEALRDGLPIAFRRRGGIAAVRRRSRGHPYNVGIEMRMAWRDGAFAEYAFEVSARSAERYEVSYERCTIQGFLEGPQGFEMRDGQPIGGTVPLPAGAPRDDLVLRYVDGPPALLAARAVATAIVRYAPDPLRLRTPSRPVDPHVRLSGDAANAAAVVAGLRADPAAVARLLALRAALPRVAAGMTDVSVATLGAHDELVFHRDDGAGGSWPLDVRSIPDGTLRAFAHLLALAQPRLPAITALEEPELGLHPAAITALADALLEASRRTQLVITTHAPPFLDHPGIHDDALVVVRLEQGGSVFEQRGAGARPAARQALEQPAAAFGRSRPPDATTATAPDDRDRSAMSSQLPI